jgi:hypothetical protein
MHAFYKPIKLFVLLTGWVVDEASGMLTPCSKFVDDEEAVSSDQQLKALTDFVSFFDK